MQSQQTKSTRITGFNDTSIMNSVWKKSKCVALAFVLALPLYLGCNQNRYQPAAWKSKRTRSSTTLPGENTPMPGGWSGSTLPGSTLPGSTLPGSQYPRGWRFQNGSTLPGSTLPSGRGFNGSTLPGRNYPLRSNMSTLPLRSPNLNGSTLPRLQSLPPIRSGSTLPTRNFGR